MSLIRPFKAIRPISENVLKVAAVPYDVLSRSEASELASDNPLSFLHVSRPEIDLPSEQNVYSDLVYQTAKQNFQNIIKNCPMIEESEPCLYIYQIQMGKIVQTGVAGCFSLDEYDSSLIKKHEKTRPEKENDRTQHILSVSAQTGPVFLTYRRAEEIDLQVSSAITKNPLYYFTAPDGISHRVWKVEDQPLVQLFEKHVSTLYIADGHHRAAAASRARSTLRAKNQAHRGDENYNYLYGVAFPDSHVNILPYNRVVKDLNGLSHNQFLERIESIYHVSIGDKSIPPPKEFGMYVGKKWYRIWAREKSINSVLHDVDHLQEYLLGPILGIADPRTDTRIEFVGGIRGTEELERWVNSQKAVVAFSLHPTSIHDVMNIADSGGIMPPKSTWFEPKLRDGILNYSIS